MRGICKDRENISRRGAKGVLGSGFWVVKRFTQRRRDAEGVMGIGFWVVIWFTQRRRDAERVMGFGR